MCVEPDVACGAAGADHCGHLHGLEVCAVGGGPCGAQGSKARGGLTWLLAGVHGMHVLTGTWVGRTIKGLLAGLE